MATRTPLLLRAVLGSLEVEGNTENGKTRKRSQYSVRLYVADKEVSKSTNSKPRSSVLRWEWSEDNQIWFEPSSIMKVVISRGFGTNISLFNELVGQHEGKIVDLLENTSSFDLTDKKGDSVPLKMKIVLSPISESDENVKKFMEQVDADILRLLRSNTLASTVSALGQVLKSTTTIMDKLSQVHPILNASWTVVSSLYQAIQATDLQDEAIRDLAVTLREMLGTADAIPDLPVIQNTTNVIEDISRQSLQAASLIHEYTKLPWAGRTVKIQIPGNLKLRIETCRKSCAALKDNFYSRLHIDTNTQVKEVKATLHQTGRKLDIIMDDQLADRIHRWLSPPDSSKNRHEADEIREVDTCSWFLEGERFLEWQTTPGFLWVNGKAGSGKSILCASVINHLSERNPPLTIAYFFFDGRDAQSELQLHDKLIRSLISQFSHQRGGIPPELADLYRRCGDHQQPSVNQLQNTLREIVDEFSQVYIIIDALDECTDRGKTLTWVNKLVSDTDPKARNLHVMVTSRPEIDIKKVIMAFDIPSMDVGEETANRDILKYLEHHMSSDFKQYDEITRKEIESVLKERADGSFRWVALQLAELERCSSQYQIMQQLENLPEGLEDTYKRILKGVDGKYRADTMTFLQWLAFSRRPMEIAEVAEAITVDFGSEDGPIFIPTKRYIDPRDVLVRCSSLVSESEGTVKLSHFSVKEYLLSTRIEEYFRLSEETAHSRILEISVVYLLQFDSFEPLTKDILRSSSLAQYAAEHWISHAKFVGINPALLKLILRLFTSQTAVLTNWIRMYNIDRLWRHQDLSMDRAEVQSALYYSSLAGLQQVSERLLNRGENVNVEGGEYGNPLQAASFRGHQATVKLLLENNADVNAQGGRYGSALQAASGAGHADIVKTLLESEAKVNEQGGRYGNALQAASEAGHEAIVKLLLENGAEVNAQGGRYGNALQAASEGGHEQVVKLLLEYNADVNAQGGRYGNALQAASEAGHEIVVRLLLENNANVNAQGGRFGNALQAACSGSHEEIVKVLVENGADVNAQGGRFGSPLQVASSRGHAAIVKLLLKNGADVNMQGERYSNALQAACSGDHEAIARLLLENGAKVNAQGGIFGNALQAASLRGHEATVKLLLDHGADINAQGGEHGSALQAASSKGHEAVVKLLLAQGAQSNVVTVEGVSASGF